MSADQESQSGFTALADRVQQQLVRSEPISTISGSIGIAMLGVVVIIADAAGIQSVAVGAIGAIGVAMLTANGRWLQVTGSILTVTTTVIVAYMITAIIGHAFTGPTAVITALGTAVGTGAVMVGFGIVALYLQSVGNGELYRAVALLWVTAVVLTVIWIVTGFTRGTFTSPMPILQAVTDQLDLYGVLIQPPATAQLQIVGGWIVLVVYASLLVKAVQLMPRQMISSPAQDMKARQKNRRVAAVIGAGVGSGVIYLLVSAVAPPLGVLLEVMFRSEWLRLLLLAAGTIGGVGTMLLMATRASIRWTIAPEIPVGWYAIAGPVIPLVAGWGFADRIVATVIDDVPVQVNRHLIDVQEIFGQTLTALTVIVFLVLIGALIMSGAGLMARWGLIGSDPPGVRIALLGAVLIVAEMATDPGVSGALIVLGIVATVMFWECCRYGAGLTAELGANEDTGRLELIHAGVTAGVLGVLGGGVMALLHLQIQFESPVAQAAAAAVALAILTASLALRTRQAAPMGD